MMKLKITYRPDGSRTVEALGFTDAACRTATDPYRKRQGLPTEDVAKTEEELAKESQDIIETAKQKA